MDRLHIAAKAEAVGTDGVNHFVGCVRFRQQFRRFLAVLVGILFKVHIVKQAAQTPKVRILPGFLGKPTHNALHSQRMLNMEWFLIVFLQQGHCLLTGKFHSIFLLRTYVHIVTTHTSLVN